MLFGTSFVNYAQLAARGFADPAAYILFVAGLLVVLGITAAGPNAKFTPAFFGALLLALAILMKPLVAAAAAVVLGGAGLHALYLRQWPRLIGLCVGFLPVFSMALHNYVFGGVFVLFSSNVGTAAHTSMSPSAYVEAAHELLTANLDGSHIRQGFLQVAHWLAGPSQLFLLVPLHVGAIGVLLYVVCRGRKFDPWLRLIALAALVQHLPALFYAPSQRYYFLAWLLTALVCLVWIKDIGFLFIERRYPLMSGRIRANPWPRRLESVLSRLQKASS
jgi:hypothetical protein